MVLIFRWLTSLFSILSIILFLSSCGSANENTSENNSAISEIERKSQDAWQSSGEIVQKITLNSLGVFRGLELGIPMSTIHEKIELAENQPKNGKSFTIYFDETDLNFADITYSSDGENNLSQIDIDLFVEESSQVKQIIGNFSTYFNTKFGASRTQGNLTIWDQQQKARVSLENVSTSKDPGIKIIFKKNN